MHPVRILFIEKDPTDAILTQAIFKESKTRNEFQVVPSIELALQYVRRQGPYKNAASPDLIMFDLDLFGIEGYTFLREIKNDYFTSSIPVIVFASNLTEKETNQLYALSANCCIPKPADFEEFARMIESIEQFWLHTARIKHLAA